jgi:hypothetical protein
LKLLAAILTFAGDSSVRLQHGPRKRLHVVGSHLKFADHLGLDAAVAFDGCDNRRLVGSATARFRIPSD